MPGVAPLQQWAAFRKYVHLFTFPRPSIVLGYRRATLTPGSFSEGAKLVLHNKNSNGCSHPLVNCVPLKCSIQE